MKITKFRIQLQTEIGRIPTTVAAAIATAPGVTRLACLLLGCSCRRALGTLNSRLSSDKSSGSVGLPVPGVAFQDNVFNI